MSLVNDFESLRLALNQDTDNVASLISGSVGTSNGSIDYTLPSGYIVTIDANGLSSIRTQGTQVAIGKTQLIDGTYFFQLGQNGSIPYIPVIASKFFLARPNGAKVTHNYTGAFVGSAVFDYTITGDRVDISVLVTNKGSADFNIIGFRSLGFLFDSLQAAKDSSNLLGYDSGHTSHNGTNLTYPSGNIPLAATYVRTLAGGGKPLNLCTWPGGSPFDQFMTLRDGTYNVPGHNLVNFFFKTLPASGSQVYKFTYLFSNSTDPFVLLQDYKDYLRSQLGLQYDPDARPWVRFTSINASYVRPDNPYGYNDGGDGLWRRFDKLAGCQNYVAKLLAPMQDVNYQGIICWQPQGINPRGVQYRPDFNVWPTESVPNIPTLFGGFTSGGKRFGLLARPGIAITSASWTTDGTIRTSDQPDVWSDLSSRLKWATDRGVTAFYLDSFVVNGPDHNILKLIRSQLGTNAQLYAEGTTILSAALAGVYFEFKYLNGNYVYPRFFDVTRFIYPEAIYFANLIGGTLPPGGFPAYYTYCFQNKLTPMVEDYLAQSPSSVSGSHNSMIKPLVAQYIDSNNHWK